MDHEIIEQFDIFYAINKEDLTALVINSPNARGDVLIPFLIKHDSQEFKIIGIYKESFKNNNKIKSIKIPDESFIRSIGKKSLFKFINKKSYHSIIC